MLPCHVEAEFYLFSSLCRQGLTCQLFFCVPSGASLSSSLFLFVCRQGLSLSIVFACRQGPTCHCRRFRSRSVPSGASLSIVSVLGLTSYVNLSPVVAISVCCCSTFTCRFRSAVSVFNVLAVFTPPFLFSNTISARSPFLLVTLSKKWMVYQVCQKSLMVSE